MSATTPRESYECAYCGGARADDTHGSYCSPDCFYHAKGEALINRISHDGRFCATCYGRLRDVTLAPEHKTPGPDYEPRVTCPACFAQFVPNDYEKPQTDCPECDHPFTYDRLFLPGPKNIADGVQHAKDRLTHGIDARDGPNGYYEFQRESCVCGAVDPNSIAAEIQQIDLERVKENCFQALRWLTRTDDDLPVASRERYAEALGERPYDAAYACGFAVYGGEE